MRQEIIDHIISWLGGSTITAIAWIVKTLYRAKRDIDFAHHKIRILEQQIKSKE